MFIEKGNSYPPSNKNSKGVYKLSMGGEKMSKEDFQLKEYVQIDGHQHGMIIEGQNKENPVVLFYMVVQGFRRIQ